MYKLSEYNILVKTDNGVALFNRISGKIVKIESEVLKRDLEHGDLSDYAMEFIEELSKDGFVIPNEVNENIMVQYNINEMIYNRVLELIIVPTTNCNFRCEYCYQDFPNKYMGEEIQKGIIEYVKKNIKGFAGLRVNWYGGEPLMATNIVNQLSSKLLELCRRIGKPYLSTITTNGYLLTSDVFSNMIKNNVVVYVVTIDGTEEYHDKYRHLKNGEGTFNKIINNLKYIRDNAPKNLFSILVRINVTKESLNKNLADLLKYFSREFGNDSRFEFLVYPVSDWGGKSINQIKDKLYDSYDEIFDFLIANETKLNFKPYYKYLMLGSCWAAKRHSYLIDPDGCVKKCTMLVDKIEHTIGKITSTGKMELDEYMLARWIMPEKRADNMCDNCDQRLECISYCPLIKNFSVANIDCEFKFFNIEKIVELLMCCDKYVELKKY